MNDHTLKELSFGVTARLDPGFRAGTGGLEITPYVTDFYREIDLRPFRAVVDETMKRFDDPADRARSDSWLGPRLHHSLRLHRNEAARRGVWLFLAVADRPDYVRWRFGGEDGTDEPARVERFAGPDYKHAFARLWWMSELFRNGPDYRPAVQALSNQDIVNNLFRMDVAHHRPTALGAVKVLFPDGEKPRTGREANALAKAVNAAATTLQLDAFALDEGLDEAATTLWVNTANDVVPDDLYESLPNGPEDSPVPETGLDAMEKLLAALLLEAPVRGRRGSDELQGEQSESPAAPEPVVA